MDRIAPIGFILYTPILLTYNNGMYPNNPFSGDQPVQTTPSASTPPPLPPSQPNLGKAQKPHRSPWPLIAVGAVILALATSGLAVWAYLQYIDQRDTVDSKVAIAVTEAVKTQADKDAADFLEKEKQPNRQFTGPEDYGRVSFEYPKTWSIYVAKDAANGGTYEAYLNPVLVPTVSATQQYALRVLIQDTDYDKVVDSYKSAVSKGDLKQSNLTVGDVAGVRLDGKFSNDIVGSAAIFKIRDKTVILRTDAQTFRSDFDALLATVTYNK